MDSQVLQQRLQGIRDRAAAKVAREAEKAKAANAKVVSASESRVNELIDYARQVIRKGDFGSDGYLVRAGRVPF